MAVNGEAPTTAKPSSTILQGIGTGTVVKLEFTSEPQAVSAMTEAGGSSSVSASQSKAQTVSVAVKARDAQKMSHAAELLEAWKLDPSELVHGDRVGAGGDLAEFDECQFTSFLDGESAVFAQGCFALVAGCGAVFDLERFDARWFDPNPETGQFCIPH